MIISTITGGFGNQLFIYACGYAVTQRQKSKYILDATYLATDSLRSYEIGKLNIQYDRLCNISEKLPYVVKVVLRKLLHLPICVFAKMYTEKTAYKYDEGLLEIKGNYRLRGYWQSEKYFKEYRQDILKMLEPNYKTTKSFKMLKDSIQNSQSVSVHIRRGDYVGLGICLDASFYKRAIAAMLARVANPVFYVFSDEIEYAKGLFKEIGVDAVFINYEAVNSTIEDFLLMKSCKHNIIANSSYSWWGAWANINPSKIVVCPKRDIRDDFYPEDWIQI